MLMLFDSLRAVYKTPADAERIFTRYIHCDYYKKELGVLCIKGNNCMVDSCNTGLWIQILHEQTLKGKMGENGQNFDYEK